MWDGQERRMNRDGESHKDSTNILLELQSLNQTLREQIFPLVKRHEECLFGPKGDNGIVGTIGFLKKLWILLATLLSSGIVVGLIDLLRRK